MSLEVACICMGGTCAADRTTLAVVCQQKLGRTQSRAQDMAMLLVIMMYMMIAGKRTQRLCVLKAECSNIQESLASNFCCCMIMTHQDQPCLLQLG